MQQQSFNKALGEWETFLGKSARRYIRIKDLKKMKWVNKKDTSEMPSRFFMVDVLKNHSSIEEWFNRLMLDNDLENATINFKVLSGSNGTANVVGYPEKTYNLAKRLELIKSQNQHPNLPGRTGEGTKPENTTAVQKPVAPAPYSPGNFIPPYSTPPNSNGAGLGAAVLQHSGGAMAAAHAAGLGLSDFIDLKKSAELGAGYKKELDKLKNENEGLIKDNRDLKSRVEHAARNMELELKMAKLEKSGFADSEAGQKILASLPEMAAMFMQQKGGQPQQSGMGGASNLSEAKTRLIEFISDSGISDPIAELLEQVLALISSKQGYIDDLRQLNLGKQLNQRQYAINGNG